MKRFGNKITKITKIDAESFCVQLRFSDKTQSWVSLKHIFIKPKGLAAEVLKGNLFDSCFIEAGALAWPNGLELCPDALRQLSETQKKNKNSAA